MASSGAGTETTMLEESVTRDAVLPTPDGTPSGTASISGEPHAGDDDAPPAGDDGDNNSASKEKEDDVGEQSDSSVSSTDSSSADSDTVDKAARMNSVKLHRAYLQRLEKHKGKRKDEHRAPVMVRGIVDYMKMLEDRIKFLEVNGVARPDGAEADASQAKEDDVVGLGSVVRDIGFYHAKGEFLPDGNWMDNTLKKGSYQSKLDPNYLIRVLYDWEDGKAPSGANKECPEPSEIDILAFGMMSRPLASFFNRRIGIDMEEGEGFPVRFGKPFRPFIRNFQAIKDQLARLERKYGSDGSTEAMHGTPMKPRMSKSGADGGNEPETPQAEEGGEAPAFETPEALDHFRFLVDFVEKYLVDMLDRFNKLKEGLTDRVTFEDLWMLFSTGDTIYAPSVRGGFTFKDGDTTQVAKTRHCPQLFRCLGTKGGLSFRKILAASQEVLDDEVFENHIISELLLPGGTTRQDVQLTSRAALDLQSYRRNKTKFTSLYVLCFNIDFDGVSYGTVREFFLFKPFNGLVDIRSLEAYPVKYLKPQISRPLTVPQQKPAADDDGNEDEKVDDIDPLVVRGRKFVDVTSVSHMSYEGLTLGHNREEINSAVIVDFKSSFQEYQNEFLEEDVMPTFTRISGLWPPEELGELFEIYKTKCADGWCHKLDCLRDPCYASQGTQVEKIEREIKSVLEEYDNGTLHSKGNAEWFKKYMEEKDLIRFLPGVVPGFALRNRKWVQLDLDLLEELKQGDNWDDLVLPSGHRSMVQAMVETHTRSSRESRTNTSGQRDTVSMDLVKGKGRGCIILLHGVPGVGKTSTAECVAAYTKRPLYPITSGDIGYLPEQVEKSMEKHFRLAHKWSCVLLLDEADVFLAKRNRTDVKRNGLVSVFLRILEYYSGILFLTTNRVGAIDDAFRSRLHLTLYYPKLTGKQTTRIWKNNLDRLLDINEDREARQRPPISFNKKKLLRWVKVNNENLQWNGRQIRNAIQTAVALAEFEAKQEALAVTSGGDGGDGGSTRKKKKSGKSKDRSPGTPLMTIGHFELIAMASMQFNEYLHETLNNNEDEVAALDRVRAQSYTSRTKLRNVEEDYFSSSSSSSSEDEEDADSNSDDDSEAGANSSDESGSDESSDSSDEDLELLKKKKRKKKAKALKAKVKSKKKKESKR